MQLRYLITAASKAKRLDMAKQMENMCSASRTIWSAERIFTVEHHVDTQNDRILATSSASSVQLSLFEKKRFTEDGLFTFHVNQ